MRATQGMHKSFPGKSASTLSVTGSSGLLLQLSGCGEKQDYSEVLEYLNKVQ